MNFRDQFAVEEHLTPPAFREYPEQNHPGVRGILYEGAPYHGKPTSCFAWLGLPKRASAKHRVPGIVLVHGGGGTAFADWVRVWTERGYAAIAMDTCGCRPDWSPQVYWAPQWPRLPDGGAPGWGGFDQLEETLADQWCFQATAAVLRATALLKSLPEIDEAKVGLAGISWGGYLTLVATTVAPQGTYRFAIPVYASAGFTRFRTGILLGRPEVTAGQADEWTKRWDPLPGLAENRTPMLFLTDAEDAAFPAPSWQRTTEAVAGTVQRSMRIDFPHDHQSSFQSRTEAVFAEACLKGKTLPVWGTPVQEGRRLVCEICANGRRFCETSLFYTRAAGFWGDRRWRAVPATLHDGVLSAVLQPETTAAFFGVKDTQGCRWSSGLVSNVVDSK